MAHLGPSLRRTRRREHPGWRALAAVLVSLALNALLASRLDASWFGFGTGPVREIEMAPLSATAWEANRAIRAAPVVPAPAPVPAPRPAEARGQVVEVAPSANSTPPTDSRFLSDRNNTVEKETRARVARPGQPRTLPVPSVAGAPVRPAAPPGEDGRDGRNRPGRTGDPGGEEARRGQRLAMAKSPAPEPPGGDMPGAPLVAPAPPASPGDASPGSGGEGGERRSGRFDPRLSVPAETLARLLGGPAPDHLKGVEEGEGTYLNTREWKYATYFNRIKQAVASAWDGKPQHALELRDPDRTMFAYKDRYTVLAVTLDDAGQVKDLQVAQSSGVEFLDRTALDAFRTAQPFVNPPRGVVDDQGEIRFTFGFYLEVGRAGFSIQRRR